MNSHIPFDANNDWTLDPYHCNQSNDPLVDKVIGNAYAVVRAVYCNLGNLKLLYDFLNTYGMVIGVKSEADLKKLNKLVKYARIYGYSSTNDRQVTDYLYVPDDTSGIRPDDPTATGSWIKVATSATGGSGEGTGQGAYIPYVYANGSALGGETSFKVPDGTIGVPFLIINGSVQYIGYGFNYSAATATVTLSNPLVQGDEVVALTTAVPANPDNPEVPEWVQVNWLYNNGSAVGGEQVITVPYNFQDVPAVYKNGLRLYKGLQSNSYVVDQATHTITMTEILAQGDRVILTLGGESETLTVTDRTLQEVARATNVEDKDVVLSSTTNLVITGKKVIYDVSAQKIWGLPTLPPNAYIVKVDGDKLTYNPGNVTVNLLPAPGSVKELEEVLDSTTGASKIKTSSGSTVQDSLSALGLGYYLDTNKVSTDFMSDKKAMVVYQPMTVVDSDNQGAKILDNTTIIGAIPNQNPIKTLKKAQSALRLAGSNIVLKQLRGEGSADNTNTSTSEFITSRMSSVVDGISVKNLVVDDVFVTGFTTGIALSGVDGAVLTNIRGENLRFSPDGLNSAGGYLFVFGGGTSKNINISNVYHKLVAGADRHTLYISAMNAETGWKNVVCENITCDWSANTVNNKGTNGVPFAMNPIHVRTGDGLCINNYTVTGYCAGIVVLENQYGPITNVTMTNMVAMDCQSYQNGTITDTGSIDIGFGAYAYRNQYINISNCITKIIRGTNNAGTKMAAGSDIGVVGANADFINIVNNQFTMESGAAVRLISCNDVVIDDITDTLLDTTSGINSIILNNCSRVTIGNIRSNRAPTTTKERVYTITDTCTEITCRFTRRIVLLVTNNTVTVTEDRWDMLNGAPIANVDGKTINVPLKNHVSTNAKRTCNIHNTTMANVKAIRVGDIDSNTLRVGFWDTSLNAQATPTTANNLVVIEFTC